MTDLPCRNDEVFKWIHSKRNQYEYGTVEWYLLHDMLTDYQLHADTGTKLSKPAQMPSF